MGVRRLLTSNLSIILAGSHAAFLEIPFLNCLLRPLQFAPRNSSRSCYLLAVMSWLYLILAGLLEIAWAIGLKYTHGFTRLWPSVATIVGMILSFFLLSQALKTIPVGTGYAIWTGIGAAGTAILGMIFFNESREAARIVCLLLIVSGVIGLKFFATNS